MARKVFVDLRVEGSRKDITGSQSLCEGHWMDGWMDRN